MATSDRLIIIIMYFKYSFPTGIVQYYTESGLRCKQMHYVIDLMYTYSIEFQDIFTFIYYKSFLLNREACLNCYSTSNMFKVLP